jgi:hypothetical protein
LVACLIDKNQAIWYTITILVQARRSDMEKQTFLLKVRLTPVDLERAWGILPEDGRVLLVMSDPARGHLHIAVQVSSRTQLEGLELELKERHRAITVDPIPIHEVTAGFGLAHI